MKISLKKYKFIFLLPLLFFSNLPLHAQNLSQHESLLKNANDFVYYKPEEAIKIGKHLLENAESIDEKIIYSWTIAKGYFVKGDYENTLLYAYKINNQSENNDNESITKERIHLAFLKYNILKTLILNNQADTYVAYAEHLIETINDAKIKTKLKCELLLHKAFLSYEMGEYHEAQNFINEIENNYLSDILNENTLKHRFYIISGAVKSEMGDYDSAMEYFNKSLIYFDQQPNPNHFEKARLLTFIGRFNFLNKNHPEAIKNLLLAIEDAKQIDNTPLLHKIYRLLVVNYLAINDKENYKLYNSEFLVYNNKLEMLEQASVNTAFNLINKEQDYYFDSEKIKLSKSFYIVLALSSIVICVLSFIYFRNRWQTNRLKEIIRYLEISRNVYNKPKSDKITVHDKRFTIPKETEQNLLLKLKKFENSKKFTSKDMSLAVLAGQFETNTKYLSEIINTHYQDNFNTYINKLRIDYIIEKLKSDPNYMHYKISYLAEKCGFSSHSSFATVFKSIAGITPVTFIELLKEEKEILHDDEE